ncbi:chitobiase/beta-hexosaminidase C-terminal domain-containing protein [Zobellia sp. OII3]|uniref:chitobiase/beta-hexosaminidase C-terminal domain-containing protein n=1 Tax=Zobellia sp. OII3 TaxID=2034520 RepID=UPI0013748178|nr:chitobiase/beta-hexosaminidase C-terminal domain-containing protein [Zobellia sp. OII3]
MCTKKLTLLAFCITLFLGEGLAQEYIPKGEQDFYKGSHGPDADYILEGGLIKDLPPMPKVDFDFKGEGFDSEKLSEVPEPGVHPRVIMSPSDVERMKKMVAMGDQAPKFFKLQLEDLRKNVQWEVPENFEYYANPFGADGNIAKWALLALLTDDQDLGRRAAEATVAHALYLEPRIDILNHEETAESFKDVSYDFVRTDLKFGPYTYAQAYYSGGRKRVEELKEKYGMEYFFSNTPGGYFTLGWEYDYGYNFMTKEERTIVRRVIAKATYGKYDTGMAIPGQMYINNHMSCQANWIPLALAIEGEKGYDERILPIATWSLQNKLNYDLSSSGTTYENTKGFIPMLAVWAAGRRGNRNLLKHSHLLARAESEALNARKIYNRYVHRPRQRPNAPGLEDIRTGFDEPRFWRTSPGSGTGGHLEFWHIMKYFYPKDTRVDFVYNIKNSIFNADMFEGKKGEDYSGKLHKSWFQLPGITLITASEITSYEQKEELDQFEDMPRFWYDGERGMVTMGNGWQQDDMLVHMENRVDQYYAGHETPQHGDFQIWSHGIPWSPNVGAYRDASYRALVTVDGLAGVYQPVSGDSMTATNTAEAASSVVEMTTAYGWRKYEKLMELDHPALAQVNHIMGRFKESAYKLDRFSELPFQPRIKEHYDGFGHLDYGPWHGETRGVERYGKWANDMDHVFRTMHFARGKKPYLLVIDDLKKDDKAHQYDWRMPLIGDSYVYEVNPAAQNRHLELNTKGVIGTDIIMAMADNNVNRGRAATWEASYPVMKPNPKKGDPMLLVRVLWRNSNFPFPLPNVQKAWGYNMLSIPANAVDPEYKVMLFPFRFGDKLPTTVWSDDLTQLTVNVGGNTDIYTFGRTDKERTVYAMERNGKNVMNSKATPSKPILIEKGQWTIDHNNPGYRPARLFIGKEMVSFEPSQLGSVVYYTTDGTEPGPTSKVYDGPIKIDKSCLLKARTYQDSWEFGEKWSPVSEFAFQKASPLKASGQVQSVQGLSAKVYELKTTIYDKKGFFQGDKISLPEVEDHKPILTSTSSNFTVPFAEPRQSSTLMTKSFYLFEGYFEAKEDGVYRFEVSSNGPIDFSMGTASVLRVDKQYGLSYKSRYGEVALAKGKHKFRLLVCDPMFWKGDIEEAYKIKVGVKRPGEKQYTPVQDQELTTKAPFVLRGNETHVDQVRLKLLTDHSKLKYAYTLDGSDPLVAKARELQEIVVTEPGLHSLHVAAFKNGSRLGEIIGKRIHVLKAHPAVEVASVQGIRIQKYDRIDLLGGNNDIPENGLAPSYFEVKGSKPYEDRFVTALSANDTPRKLMVYTGLFEVVADGVYEFMMPNGKDNSVQLVIDGETVLHRRVHAPALPGSIYLKKGKHRIQIKVALGKAEISVKYPNDNAVQDFPVSAITVPLTPTFKIAGEELSNNAIEIFEDTQLSLAAPDKAYKIRYSLNDGKIQSYKRPLKVSKSTVVKAGLFKNKTLIGEFREVHLERNEIPEKGLVAYLASEEITNGLTPVNGGGNVSAVVEGGVIVPGKIGNGIGLFKKISQLVVDEMHTHEDAATVSMWINFKDKSNVMFVTGLPYFYEEYTLENRGSALQADYARGIGLIKKELNEADMAPGKWFHVAATYGEEIRLYFNGQMINSVQVQNKSARRGSGRASKINLMVNRSGAANATMDECRIYDRVLTAKEIETIYNAEK